MRTDLADETGALLLSLAFVDAVTIQPRTIRPRGPRFGAAKGGAAPSARAL